MNSLHLYHPTRGPLRATTRPVGKLERLRGSLNVIDRKGKAVRWDLYKDESGNIWAKKA